ncbi:MAG TPA: type II toxin-antitoxin system VapC family toxin [Isosphaeraceae bacterium]|nr:type II toxin-antitoxin system VapC family toxin [Isosphaeraceae bacterium]
MRLLLDTHAVLWFALNDSQLSGTAISLILDPANEKFVSPASDWEIAIKISAGKYSLAVPFEDFFRNAVDDNGFRRLPIELRHTAALTTLPYHHRDPFDRLLVATALVEGLALVSADSAFDAYGVTRLW